MADLLLFVPLSACGLGGAVWATTSRGGQPLQPIFAHEVTSQLDAINGQAVRAALADRARTRTTLVIAHRLSAIRGAGRIVVLDSGQGGSRAALVAERPLCRLVSRQVAAASS